MIGKERRWWLGCSFRHSRWDIRLLLLVIWIAVFAPFCQGSQEPADEYEDCAALQVSSVAGSSPVPSHSEHGLQRSHPVMPVGGASSVLETPSTNRASLLEAVSTLRAGLNERRAAREKLEQKLSNETREVKLLQDKLKREEPREGHSALFNFLIDVEDEIELNQGLLAAVVLGVAVVSVLTCVCSRYTLSKRHSEYMRDDEDVQDRSWLYQCCCGCSLATKVSFYAVLFTWSLGLVVLYKLGMLEELMGQIAVFFLILSLIVMTLSLIVWEYWNRASGELHNILSFFDHLHEKIDGMLAALGFAALDEESSSDSD